MPAQPIQGDKPYPGIQCIKFTGGLSLKKVILQRGNFFQRLPMVENKQVLTQGGRGFPRNFFQSFLDLAFFGRVQPWLHKHFSDWICVDTNGYPPEEGSFKWRRATTHEWIAYEISMF